MTTFRPRLAAVLLIGMTALLGHSAPAQLPSPSITNLVTGATNAIWDASLRQWSQWMPGGYMDVLAKEFVTLARTNITSGRTNIIPGRTNFIGSETLALFLAPFVQNGRGGLSGHGTNTIRFESFYTSSNSFGPEVDFAGKYGSSGSMFGLKGIALIDFTSRASGQTPLDGRTRSVSISSALRLYFYAASYSLKGSYANIISVSGRPTVAMGGLLSQLGLFTIPNQFGDGSWTLVMNTTNVPPGNRLSGSATITLNSGAVYPFIFKGTYLSAGKQPAQSKLALAGVKTAAGDGLGSTLGVTLQGDRVVAMSGRVAGQNISLK
jgi:hypothetical protein